MSLRAADRAIAELELDLRGLTVFTEAASGPYLWTPLLAARAGARVLALARDNGYHRADDVEAATLAAAREHGLDVTVVRDKARLPEADVVTNSASLRPITAADVEAHEADRRAPADVGDLGVRGRRPRPRGLPAPRHRRPGHARAPPAVRPAALPRRARAAAAVRARPGGREVPRAAARASRSSGREIARFLREAGCVVTAYAEGVRLAGHDALLVAEAADRRLLIGPGGLLEPADIPRELKIGVIAGTVDAAAARAAGLTVFPEVVQRRRPDELQHRRARARARCSSCSPRGCASAR